MKKIITNVEIAKAVVDALEENGIEVSFNRILDEIDIGREPEEEKNLENPEIISQYINGFLAEYEEAWERRIAMNDISTLLKLRLDAGMTQAELSRRSGVNARQIRSIERGEIKIENVTLANADLHSNMED